jgi:hypothetical protein
MFRADMYVLSLAVGIGVLRARGVRASVALARPAALGALLASLPIWAFNAWSHGHALPLNATKNFARPDTSYLARRASHVAADFLAGDTLGEQVGLWLTVIAAAILMLDWLLPRSVRGLVVVPSLALGGLVVQALVMPSLRHQPPPYMIVHGFVAVCPLVVLAWLRPEEGSEDPGLTWATTSYALLYLAMICLVGPEGPNSGGLEMGPRFFIAIYPLAIALAWARVVARGRHGTTALVAWGGTAALLALCSGVLFAQEQRGIRSAMELHAEFQRNVARVPQEAPILLTLWWSGALMPDAMLRRPVFHVFTREQLHTWLRAAARAGIERFYLTADASPVLRDLLAPPFPAGISLEALGRRSSPNGILLQGVALHTSQGSP